MTDAQPLQGRKALITGAGRGIGQALALGFARAGARVACAARTQAQVAAVADRIVRRGGTATPLVCDVTQPAQVDAMCRAAHEAWDTWISSSSMPASMRRKARCRQATRNSGTASCAPI